MVYHGSAGFDLGPREFALGPRGSAGICGGPRGSALDQCGSALDLRGPRGTAGVNGDPRGSAYNIHTPKLYLYFLRNFQ